MQLPSGPSLARRTALALALWAGFYLLAFGLAGGLLYFVYSVFSRSQPPSLLLLGLCAGAVFGAAMILWSSFPRRVRFLAPGPRLLPEEHPRLFEEIRRVAKETRQKPPAEVYLDGTVNAWVGVRGGLFGLFSRRILGLGLPLLKILSRSELRCVLAHEFGHYVGGDTRLGPWVRRTDVALRRTLDALEQNDSLWRFPFIGYAKLFTRVSVGISRRQELAADALAARIGGTKAYGRALRLIEEASTTFPGYVGEELMPVLTLGFRPPLVEGFERYRAAKEVSQAVHQIVGLELSRRKRDPEGSHPPLHERLEALSRLAPGLEATDDSAAIELLAELDRLEQELLAVVLSDPKVSKFPTVSWEEAGEKAFLPNWREQAAAVKPHVSGITPRSFPELALADIGRRFARGLSDPEARRAAMNGLGAALLVKLRDLEWTLRSEPGERPVLLRGAERVEPFHVFLDIAEGKLTREGWRSRCDAGGFADIDLGG